MGGRSGGDKGKTSYKVENTFMSRNTTDSSHHPQEPLSEHVAQSNTFSSFIYGETDPSIEHEAFIVNENPVGPNDTTVDDIFGDMDPQTSHIDHDLDYLNFFEP